MNTKYVIDHTVAYNAFETIMNAFLDLSEEKNMDIYTFYRMTDEFITDNQKQIQLLLNFVNMQLDNSTIVDIKRIKHNNETSFFRYTDGYVSITQVDEHKHSQVVTKCRIKYISGHSIKAYKYFEQLNGKPIKHNPFLPSTSCTPTIVVKHINESSQLQRSTNVIHTWSTKLYNLIFGCTNKQCDIIRPDEAPMMLKLNNLY